MKKIITLSMLAFATLVSAQTSESSEKADSSSFKRWSIDLGAGVTKPTRPFFDGYPDSPGFWQADLGVRYNLTRNFGLGIEVGYNSIENSSDSRTEFSNKLYRVGLEGIVNLGNLVNLKDVSPRLGILGHGGIGMGYFDVQSPVAVSELDFMLNFTVGLTPQFRVAKNIAVFGDVSLIGTTRNDYTWDGIPETEEIRGFEGLIVNTSLGVTFYFGEGADPADWSYYNPLQDKIDELADAVEKIESDIADDDQDGVPNYLDRDNTTESGVAVDNKGRAIDLNKNGIPDELESALDARYAAATDGSSGTDGATEETLKKLINGGYVNVYFETDVATPATYSLDAVNFMIKYMKQYPNANATITGYADEMGATEYNQDLSERRAKMVYDVLVASGVNPSRLSYSGKGEDDSVEKSSGDARQIVRKVSFKVD